MFSEYASRIMHKSQLRFGESRKARPLFHSSPDDYIDWQNEIALQQSRSRFGERLGSILGRQYGNAGEHNDAHDQELAMASSWRPGHFSDDQAFHTPDSPSSSAITNTSAVATALIDDAPADIQFGTKEQEIEETASNLSLDKRSAHSVDPRVQYDRDSVPNVLRMHDRLYAIVFVLSHAATASTSIILFLRMEDSQNYLSKGLYSTLVNSSTAIIGSSLVAAVLAVLWLLSLRFPLRSVLPIVMALLPVTLSLSSMAILLGSFFGTRSVFHVQAAAMRWSALIMLIFAGRWCHSLYSKWRSLSSAGDIIHLACSILQQNQGLMLSSGLHLVGFALYNLLWIHQFEIVFLQDLTYDSAMRLSLTSIVQASLLCLLYLWSIGVLSNLQRAWISIAVSQWYFHRHRSERQTNIEEHLSTLYHILTTKSGTICFASVLSLSTKIPLLVLPRSISTLISLLGYFLFNSALATLNDPLTTSLACIETCDLAQASQNTSHFRLLQHTSRPIGYTTAKMYLSATRTMVALASGSIVWLLRSNMKEGMYAYAVALLVATMTWTIVGSIEGLLSTIVDAALVCYSLDQRNVHNGNGHCEAANVFEEGRV